MSETSPLQLPMSIADINAMIARIPYVQFLGIQVEAEGDGIITRLDFHQNLVGNPVLPALHGGVIGAFLETTAIIALSREARLPELPKTVDITVDYLRSGRPLTTYGRATVTKHGRRVANMQVVAWQDDPAKPIAAAHGHFLLKIAENAEK